MMRHDETCSESGCEDQWSNVKRSDAPGCGGRAPPLRSGHRAWCVRYEQCPVMFVDPVHFAGPCADQEKRGPQWFCLVHPLHKFRWMCVYVCVCPWCMYLIYYFICLFRYTVNMCESILYGGMTVVWCEVVWATDCVCARKSPPVWL